MTITLDLLSEAASAGGPSALSSFTPLKPAGGEQAAIAPAKYAGRGRAGTYVFDTRFVGGEAVRTTLIDSSQSQGNRAESAIVNAITDGNPVLSRIPRIRVTYFRDGVSENYTDLELPHRAFDAHVRAGSVGGVPVTDLPTYRKARDATLADAFGLVSLSPGSLVFGSWDSTRKARQGRWASVLTGETIGVLADQDRDPTAVGKGGARVDPVGMSIKLSATESKAIADRQRDELSEGTYKEAIKGAQSSILGFGGIPPTLSALGLVACRSIIRSRVLSFATLRQLRFGQGAQGDAAIRAALAALAINAIVRADAELFLRSHCHLIEAGPTVTQIDRRHGQTENLELPGIAAADDLLDAAINRAAELGNLDWSGQVLEVEGNPAVVAAATSDESEE